MTKTLYLMRHGQTLFNKRHRIQGWCDAPLTDLGVYQAQVAGQYFKNAGITFDAAYSSTSERACDTLEIVTNGSLPYQRVKGLKEWNFGTFEGESEDLKFESARLQPSYSSCKKRKASLFSWYLTVVLWLILLVLGKIIGN